MTIDPPELIVRAYLEESLDSASKKYLLGPEKIIFKRLIKYNDEMAPVYRELLNKLPGELSWQTVIDRIAHSAAFYNEDKTKKQRVSIRHAKSFLKNIATASDKLIDLLDDYHEFNKENSLTSPLEIYDPFDLIDLSTTDNSSMSIQYRQHIKDKLAFIGNFDARYYPTTSQLLASLSKKAREHIPSSNSHVAQHVHKFRKTSPADFYRALIKGLKAYTGEGTCRTIPDNFAFTDNTIADISNYVLDLGDTCPVNADNVKSWRKEERIQSQKD